MKERLEQLKREVEQHDGTNTPSQTLMLMIEIAELNIEIMDILEKKISGEREKPKNNPDTLFVDTLTECTRFGNLY